MANVVVQLRPTAIGAYDAGTLGAGTDKVSAVDPGPGLVHDDLSSYVSSPLGGGTSPQSFKLDISRPEFAVLVSLQCWVRYAFEGATGRGGQIWARMGGVDGTRLSFTNPTTEWYTDARNFGTGAGEILRPGGGAWLLEDYNNPTLELCFATTDDTWKMQVTSIWLRAEGIPVPYGIDQARNMASRYLRLLRRPVRTISLRAPLLYSGLEIGDYVTLSHEHGPHPDGAGWGRKPWQRRVLQVMGHEVDLDAKNVKLTLLDVRNYRVLFWDSALTREPPGAQAPGCARLSVGVRQFARASKAWVESAAAAAQGATQLAQLDTDTEKQAAGGRLVERGATNFLLHSAFVSGLTGWTASGTPAPATSTPRLLFESSVTPNAIRFAPTSLAAACQIQSAAFNPGAITEGCASFWHYDETGHVLYYGIQRAVDSKWWNDAAATWDVAQVWNPMPVSFGAWARAATKPLGSGLASTNVTVTVGVPTTGTVGQINHLAHGQVENSNYPTSAIVTTTAAVTRAADDLKIENAHGRLVWPRERGTLLLTFTPLWNPGDLLASDLRNLIEVWYDADNLDRVLYRQATADLDVRRRVAGVSYDAVSVSPAPARGIPLKLAIRWASSEGEEGMADRQVDLFLNGNKVGSVTPAARVAAFPSVSYLQIGSRYGATQHADGYFSGIEVRDYVMSDEEILDLHG